MARVVEAVFYDTALKSTTAVSVRIPTGGRSRGEAAKLACNDHAHKNGYRYWAQQVPDNTHEQWVVYISQGLARSTPVKVFPTREAAEMWMVHLG